MGRVVGNRQLSRDSIVIVCEGTETEYPYFLALKDYSSIPTIRVVPNPKEVVDKAAKRNRQRVIRHLQPGIDEYTGREYCIGLPEIDAETYEEYHHEPVKWVRAARLFQERKSFYEAWAVYDLDQGRDAYHPKAEDYASQCENLHIAFSAYSVEEWFLLHFERNPKAFLKSECKDANDNSVYCGHKDCQSSLNCHGETCLGGRLRESRFIPEYEKNMGQDYAAITIDLLHIAFVNAAWTRSLSNEPFYRCNPYSNVDKLVMRLLQCDYDIQWIKIGEIFELYGDSHIVDMVDGELKLIYVGSKSASILTGTHIYWCNDKYEPITTVLLGERCILDRDDNPFLPLINKPDGVSVLCIKARNGKEYYCECK